MPAKPRLLIVEDDPVAPKNLQHILESGGEYQVVAAAGGSEALELLASQHFELVLTDLRMEKVDGMQVLAAVKKDYPETEVIMLTAFASVDSAIEAMKRGAFHYIAKPYKIGEVRAQVAQALEKVGLRRELKELKREAAARDGVGSIVGKHPRIHVMDFVRRVARSPDAPVLILGETGTGKELIAGAIHYQSPLYRGPLVTLNCAALPTDLIESELFGYEPGAFSGAKSGGKKCTHPGDLWTVDRFKKLLAGEISDYTVEKRYLRRDGSMWWASVRCSMARADDGHPKYFIVIVEDITSSKATEEELEAKVAQRTAELEAANTALKVMLNHRAEEKREVEEEVAASVGQLVMPFLERLLTSGLTPNQRALAEAVRSGVTEITSPLAHRLSSKLVGLTPKELEVARLVKDGKNSSEIAQLLSISHNAVAFHRQNIRAKLGLKRKKVNLCSYLMQMSDR